YVAEEPGAGARSYAGAALAAAGWPALVADLERLGPHPPPPPLARAAPRHAGRRGPGARARGPPGRARPGGRPRRPPRRAGPRARAGPGRDGRAPGDDRAPPLGADLVPAGADHCERT